VRERVSETNGERER
jgi:hypothetical protein